MYRKKYLYDNLNQIYAEETSDVNSTRNGRTFSINVKYNFGKMQEEKRRGRREMGFGSGGGMDMGY